MTLEEAWRLVENINDIANEQSKVCWLSGDIKDAVKYQSICFRKNFDALETVQQQLIIDWTKKDDEFLDYFMCLFGKESFQKI